MAAVNNISEGQPVGNTVVDVSEFIELVYSHRCKLCGAVFDATSSAAAKHVVTSHFLTSAFTPSATDVICPSKPVVEQGPGLNPNAAQFTVPLPFTTDSVYHQEVTTTQLNSMPSVAVEEKLSQNVLATLPGQSSIAVGNTVGGAFVGNTLFPGTVDSHHDGGPTCDVSVANAPRQMRVLINGFEVWLSLPNEAPVQANGSEKTHLLGPDTAGTSVVLSDVCTGPTTKTGLNLGGVANSSESQNVVELLPTTNAHLFASKLGTDRFTANGSRTAEKTSGDLNGKECYLCSKCQMTFVTLDECKEHMIHQHPELLGSTLPDVLMPPNTISIGTQAQMYKKPGRKRKIVPSGEVIQLDGDANVESPVVSEVPAAKKDEPEVCSAAINAVNMLGIARTGFDVNGFSKRRVRAPKALVEDYYISRRKHKKRQNVPEAFNLGCSVKKCAAKFSNPASLSYHVTCHADVDGDTPSVSVVCPECKNRFAAWKILRMHLWKMHGIDCDLFRCQADAGAETCQYRTDTLQKLELHQETHSGAKTFGCQSCGKGFKHRSQLRNHELLHQDTEGRRSSACYANKECHICKRVFANQKSLKKHIEIVHNKRRPYLCNTCGHETSRKAMLDLHLRTHTGEKPYRCDMCNYTASDHNTLRRHRMRHTGEKPYKCQYCTYMCIQAISLKTHLKNKHPGCEGIYSCDVCQYHTVNKSHWLNHLEDHKNNLIPVDDPGSVPVGTQDVTSGKSRVVCVDRETQNVETTTSTESQFPRGVALQPFAGSETPARTCSVDAIGQVPNSGVEVVELKGVTVLQSQETDANLFGDGKTTGQQIFQITNDSDEYYVILNEQGRAVMHRIDGASYQPETSTPIVTNLFLQQSNLDASASGQLSELEPSGPMVYVNTSNDQRDLGLHHILTAIHAQQQQQTVDTTAVIKDGQEDES